ncbi:MAG: energy-coupled thiamine transporter ThiT [Oscillospiraceae bacterium]|mgnify:FL=1|nr:energy-coupled thiamine transporter ThiT [Oscillospiraceae bacterium]MDD7469808.1 energy-coupled thiamine transporter ThiT [Oscillospiraceae bacterium]MDO4397316.1 energy-coupled thiamine transporter ThiT [Oscillospiraceae bacterium]MDY2678755.1 energy-coupled thiamine transporter ThiT [Oscillospiraceae bacterium]
MTKQQKVRRLVESALMVALSVVLSALPVFKLPFGGSVTLFSQVPIILIGFRYGMLWGMETGLVFGVIQMMFGFNNFSYVSGIAAYLILIFADYIVAFSCLGLGGMFKKVIKNQTVAIALGAAVVSLIRYLCHFISGATIWKEYAGDMPVWKYSLEYNGSYMLPELVISVVGVVVLSLIFDLSSEKLIRHKKQK